MICFIYDCETTGLVKNSLIPVASQPKCIEFFGHLVNDETGEVIEEIEFFADPGEMLDPIITRITGIKQEDLKGAKPFSFYSERLQAMLLAADCVVAHNLSFDMQIVHCEMLRCSGQAVWPARKICTVEQTEWIKGHRLSLTALHEELFGEGFPAAHRARTDVEALTRCYLELWKRGDL